MVACFIVNFTWLSLRWICWRFLVRLKGAEYDSVLLHFFKLWQYVFFGPLEISDSQVIAKNGFRPMRFQYSLIVNISLID